MIQLIDDPSIRDYFFATVLKTLLTAECPRSIAGVFTFIVFEYIRLSGYLNIVIKACTLAWIYNDNEKLFILNQVFATRYQIANGQ